MHAALILFPCAVASLAVGMSTAAKSIIADISREDIGTYMSAGMPIAYVFSEDADERAAFGAQLTPLAEKFSDKLSFVTAEVNGLKAQAREANLLNDSWPAFAIHDFDNRLKYPLLEHGAGLTPATISLFVEDFVAGNLKPFVKSQPVPEKQEGPVTIVVAENYEEIVLHPDKDVLLVYYNPKCRPCQKLEPRLDKLGGMFKKHADRVTIAKIDETANDVPDDIPLWPIIRLFKAGQKPSYVDFGGMSEAEELAEWIRENGNNHVDVLSSGSGEKTSETEGGVGVTALTDGVLQQYGEL